MLADTSDAKAYVIGSRSTLQISVAQANKLVLPPRQNQSQFSSHTCISKGLNIAK